MRYLRWLTIYVGRCFFYFRPTLKKEETRNQAGKPKQTEEKTLKGGKTLPRAGQS